MAALATAGWLATTARRCSAASALLLLVITAQAQDALYSALSIESVISANVSSASLSTDRLFLGPVQLELGVYSGTEFNSNIYGSENNEQSDTLIRAGINFGLVWQATDQSLLQLGAGLGLYYYLRGSLDSGLE